VSFDPATVTTLRRRWRSGAHVGENKPALRAYVRTTKIVRRARRVDPSDVYAHIPGWEGNNTIWQGVWNPRNGWQPLPNVLNVELDQDFDQNGVANTTIELDNIGSIQRTGVAGIYHTIERGYYSPFRGHNPDALGLDEAGERNAWYDVLSDKSCHIILVAGYGDATVPVFEGLVNDLDMTSRPDKIVLTCRDAGQLLTDQHVFVNAKARNVRDPITFCDRRRANNTSVQAFGADSSDHASQHPARFVLDDNTDTEWKSRDRDHAHPTNLPWVEVSLPNGRYESIELHPRYTDMTAYVCIKSKDKNAPGGNGGRKHYYNTRYSNGEWIDEHGGDTVPGTNIPYVKRLENVKAKQREVRLPDYGYDLGDDTKLRIYFTNLDRGRASESKNFAFRAGVIHLTGIRSRLQKGAKQSNWILVDDLADVVRTVFQWCGLNDWEVETTGVRLKEKSTWNRGQFLIDIINAASDQVGYAFHMRPRDSFDEDDLDNDDTEMSMGVAVWRQSNAMRKGKGVRDKIEVVHEDQTLQGVNVKWTDEPLAYNIRVRGREKKKENGGRTLGGDSTERVMYVYRPPWSKDDDYRNGNIKKYVVHHDNTLKTLAQCKVAALFIAFREALESGQAQIEAPAMPTIFLDHQTALYDKGTGLSTRIYVASRQMSYRSGENGHFKMALAGPLLDLRDVERVRKQLTHLLRDHGFNPGLSQWELEHHYSQSYRNN
jgi:hypothetical protein